MQREAVMVKLRAANALPRHASAQSGLCLCCNSTQHRAAACPDVARAGLSENEKLAALAPALIEFRKTLPAQPPA